MPSESIDHQCLCITLVYYNLTLIQQIISYIGTVSQGPTNPDSLLESIRERILRLYEEVGK